MINFCIICKHATHAEFYKIQYFPTLLGPIFGFICVDCLKELEKKRDRS